MRHQSDEAEDPQDRPGTDRRTFLRGSALGAATVGVSGLGLFGGPATAGTPNAPRDTGRHGRRYVLRGGLVLSMDPKVGDFVSADILVDGDRIVSVAQHINAGGAAEIDARGKIVVPGFVDTHHHQYETALRSFLPNGILVEDKSGSPSADPNYVGYVLGRFAPVYTPEDVKINLIVSGLSQLDAGVTTVLDTSQINHTPEHTDAAIEGLLAAGRRAVFGYAEGDLRPSSRYAEDARRVKNQWFSSDDQLVTMAMGGEVHLPTEVLTKAWKLGRELDLRIFSHAVSGFGVSPVVEQIARGVGGSDRDLAFGPDVLMIHMTGMSDRVWKAVRDAGTHVSVAAPIEMTMRHGEPPILTMQELGLEPSLSSDVETTMAPDPFTLMRGALTMQRMLVNQKILSQGDFAPPTQWPVPDPSLPPLLVVRDVLRFATLNGARGLGLERKIGSLTPGKRADIVLLDAQSLNVAPVNNAAGAVVSLMDRSNVDTVIVGGAIRKWRGELVDVDVRRLQHRLEASRERLFRAAGLKPDLLG